MTDVTYENIMISSMEDVEAVPVDTTNRYAVRSLRHGARAALKASAYELRELGYSLSNQASRLTTLPNCMGTEGPEQWREMLSGSAAQIDERTASTKAALTEIIGKLDEQGELAKAALAKAAAILEARPEGLPSPEPEPYTASDEDEYDEDEYDEDGDE